MLRGWSPSRVFIVCFFLVLLAGAVLAYLALDDFSNLVTQLDPHRGRD